MKKDANMKKSSGFTIVELIVVIIILGILAATALPRFISLEDSAYAGVADGVRGALISGVSMTQAKWKASGSPGSSSVGTDFDLTGSGTVDSRVSGSGWITGASGADTVDCDHILSTLVVGGPSSITIDTGTTVSSTVDAALQAETWTTAGWYGANLSGVCYMAYLPEGKDVGDPVSYFTYTTSSGAVSGVTATVLGSIGV